MQTLGWLWAQDGELAKLFGTPFGLHLKICDIDSFLFQKVRKKLIYWSSKFLSLSARAIIVNMVLLSSLLYFISIWAGSKQVIRRIQADVRNYPWVDSFTSTHARVNWRDCWASKKIGGLGIKDPQNALDVLLANWSVCAFILDNNNLHHLLGFKFRYSKVCDNGKWLMSCTWSLLFGHKHAPGSKL